MKFADRREVIFRNRLCSKALYSIKMYVVKKKTKLKTEIDTLGETRIFISVCFVCLQTQWQLYILQMYNIMQETQCDIMTVFTVLTQSNAKHLAIQSD